MSEIETVRVVATHPDSQGEFVVINKSDFDAEVHELYGVEPEPTGLHVGKGPAGRFYVKNGTERVSSGFSAEDEALAELERMKAAG